MTDYVSLASTRLSSSDADRWKAALICAVRINVDHDFAAQLADIRGRSVYRIYDLADAGRAWLALCPYMRVVERDHFRLDVFTVAWRVLKAGKSPDELAAFFREIILETPNPVMSQVVEWMLGVFGMPKRELTTGTRLRQLEGFEAWGEKLDQLDRAAWHACIKTMRTIIEKYE